MASEPRGIVRGTIRGIATHQAFQPDEKGHREIYGTKVEVLTEPLGGLVEIRVPKEEITEAELERNIGGSISWIVGFVASHFNGKTTLRADFVQDLGAAEETA